jgi:hypothetical protein
MRHRRGAGDGLAPERLAALRLFGSGRPIYADYPK